MDKKQFYLLFIFGLVVAAVLWMDVLGSEPVPISQVIFGFVFGAAVLHAVAYAYFSYYSEKVIFAEGTGHDKNVFGLLHKPSHQPIPRFSRVFTAKGWTWTYSGYNAGIKSPKGNDLFFGPDYMVSMVDRTVVFKGKQRRISHKTFFDYIGRDQELYNAVIEGNDKIKIYVPLPLKSEEVRKINTIVGCHDFGEDRFKNTIQWMLDRLEPNEDSFDELKKTIRGTLQVSEDIMGDIKRNVQNVSDARNEGVPLRSRPAQQYDKEM